MSLHLNNKLFVYYYNVVEILVINLPTYYKVSKVSDWFDKMDQQWLHNGPII